MAIDTEAIYQSRIILFYIHRAEVYGPHEASVEVVEPGCVFEMVTPGDVDASVLVGVERIPRLGVLYAGSGKGSLGHIYNYTYTVYVQMSKINFAGLPNDCF